MAGQLRRASGVRAPANSLRRRLRSTADPRPEGKRGWFGGAVWRAAGAVTVAVAALTWSIYKVPVGDRLSAGAPVGITFAGQNGPQDTGQVWAFQDRIDLTGIAPGELDALAATRVSAPLGRTTIRFAVEGNRESTVIVTDLRATVLDRGPSYDGTCVRLPLQGETSTVAMAVLVDEAQPRARTLDPKLNSLGDPYFDARTLTLQRGERAAVVVTVFAATGLARFTLSLEVSVNGALRRLEVTDNGRPFTLSGVPDRCATTFGGTRTLQPVAANEIDLAGVRVGRRG
ncbi:hypothetical protein [Longispora fulva]|uniref:Uncharacterized protein n=1 Tax=Longispora fulva TaxID=619741 RepID=A0A8J7GD06_9ACTN|nr:hypothetical protein [Longispora fulva]MBG6135850.1 hypothetical protein [Longispora fulva]